MKRSQMGAKERDGRSRANRSIAGKPMIKGTLNERMCVCGKPNCRCSRGEKHPALYLVRRKKGHVEQLYISREKEASVREWVKNWHEVQDHLEDISQSYWERLKRKDP